MSCRQTKCNLSVHLGIYLQVAVTEGTGKKEISFVLQGEKEAGKETPAVRHQLCRISQCRGPIPSKEKLPVLEGTSLAPQGGEGLDLSPLFKYKSEKVRQVPQYIHPPTKYSCVWEVKIFGKWCLFNMSQTLILTLKLAKKNQITEESLRVEFQESKNSGVFPFFFGGGGGGRTYNKL